MTSGNLDATHFVANDSLLQAPYPWILLGSVPFFVAVGFVWRQPIIVGPIIVAVIGFVIVKQLASQLVDEVWNAGDALIIRNKGQEDRIPLSAIVNVQFPWGVGKP